MSKLTKEDKEKLRQELVKLGLKTMRKAKQKAPVDTGRLRASITLADNTGTIQGLGSDAQIGDGLNQTPGDFSVIVGTNVEYAEYIEYGTADRPMQPFLRPAADEALREIDIDT